MRGFSRGCWAVVCAGMVIGCGEAAPPNQCAGRVEVRSESDFAKLEGCSQIDGDLWITESGLSSLEGLEQLASLRYLVIGKNPRLSSLRGLRLRAAEGVTLWNNPALVELEPLVSIEQLSALAVLEDGVLDRTALAGVHATELSQASTDAER